MTMERSALQILAGKILGLLPCEVPAHIVCLCADPIVAEAITMRNAVHLLTKHLRGETINRADAPWHTQYEGRYASLLHELKRSSYLDKAVH